MCNANTLQAIKKFFKAIYWSIRLGVWLTIVLSVLGLGYFLYLVDEPSSTIPPEVDGLVVFTGGKNRIPYTLNLLTKIHIQRLLISGLNPRLTPNELISTFYPYTKQTKEIVHVSHILKYCTDLDYRSTSTYENIQETDRWVKRNRFLSILIVTSDYHMPRTVLLSRHFFDPNYKAYYIKAPVQMSLYSSHSSEILRIYLLEYVKYAYMLLTRNYSLNSSPR